jgi:uncharacterized protein (DUF697 family)
MMKMIKQARAAFSLLNPEEVQAHAERPVSFGLVAAGSRGYAELEDFLIPPGVPGEPRHVVLERVHRASDPVVPATVDLVLYEHGLRGNSGAYSLDRNDPQATIAKILAEHADLALPLARQFPAFRKPVVDGIIRSISRENALFAIATALPDVVPSLMEIPWAFGEFASDTAFLTGNQVRMAFQIAAACGKNASLARQKVEILSIVGGAFGWRAIARELIGKIPLGGGLIPKGAIAYAGTFVVGKSLEYLYQGNSRYPKAERRQAYRDALERGKQVAASLYAGMGRRKKTVN